MIYNFKHGTFTVLPCEHDLPCRELTDEECETLNEMLRDAYSSRKS